VCWDEVENKDIWDELCNHFFNEALHFAPDAPVALSLDKPCIALLPGLEDCRDVFAESLTDIIKAKGWKPDFEGDPEVGCVHLRNLTDD